MKNAAFGHVDTMVGAFMKMGALDFVTNTKPNSEVVEMEILKKQGHQTTSPYHTRVDSRHVYGRLCIFNFLMGVDVRHSIKRRS